MASGADMGITSDMSAMSDMNVTPGDQGTSDMVSTGDMPGTTQDMGLDLGGQTSDMTSDMTGTTQDMPTDMASGPCVPPDTDVSTREGQPSDGWRWRKGTRVFPNNDESFEAGDGDFAPSIITEGEGYRIYFARKRAQGFSLWTATTLDDGDTWSEPVNVMGLEGQNYPSAIRQADGSVRLWFGSGSFDVATSQDGVNFTDQQRRILTPTQVGGFAQVSMIYPDVVASDAGNGYQMWYTGFDGQQLRIGTAFSADGVAWTPLGQAVLERRGGEGYDNQAVGQPEVRRIGSSLYMWHGGYDTSNTDPGPWRIGLAVSEDDGTTWSRAGVSVPLAANGDDMWSTRDPAVIPKADGSGWIMVYVGMSDDSKYRLLTAQSNACIR